DVIIHMFLNVIPRMEPVIMVYVILAQCGKLNCTSSPNLPAQPTIPPAQPTQPPAQPTQTPAKLSTCTPTCVKPKSCANSKYQCLSSNCPKGQACNNAGASKQVKSVAEIAGTCSAITLPAIFVAWGVNVACDIIEEAATDVMEVVTNVH
ncbi:3533_t:CDS:2, partial [Dentiscutata erythropus]